MPFAELQRRLENLVRIGTIAEVDLSDTAAPRVRVQDGDLLTGWLPFGALRAGSARLWSAPTTGEQVILLSPSGELASAVVFGSLFCAAHPAPSDKPNLHVLDFADGTRWTHDDQAGATVFEGMKTVLIRASESVTIDTPQTTHTGNNTVNRHLTYKGGLTGAGGSQVADGLAVDGSMSNNGKNVGSSHVHSGVRGGDSTTGAPT